MVDGISTKLYWYSNCRNWHNSGLASWIGFPLCIIYLLFSDSPIDPINSRISFLNSSSMCYLKSLRILFHNCISTAIFVDTLSRIPLSMCSTVDIAYNRNLTNYLQIIFLYNLSFLYFLFEINIKSSLEIAYLSRNFW